MTQTAKEASINISKVAVSIHQTVLGARVKQFKLGNFETEAAQYDAITFTGNMTASKYTKYVAKLAGLGFVATTYSATLMFRDVYSFRCLFVK